MSSIVMRAAMRASSQAKSHGLPIESEALAQIMVTALAGAAVPSLEAAIRWQIPFYFGARDTLGTSYDGMFPRNAIVDRAEKILLRQSERAGKSDFDPVQLRINAVKLTSFVIDEIMLSGLTINSQKLLFAPEFANNGLSILKGLYEPEFPPVAASVAIAAEVIPEPPSRNLKEHLLTLGSKKVIGIGPQKFSEIISAQDTFVVESPPPDLKISKSARHDKFFSDGVGSGRIRRARAELALGFFVIHSEQRAAGRSNSSVIFRAITPMISYSTGSNSWAGNIFLSDTVRSDVQPEQFEKMKQILAGKTRTFAAKLSVCANCGEIYSHARIDLSKRCTCVTTKSGA